MELEECIKDGFENSLRDFINSDECLIKAAGEAVSGIPIEFTDQSPENSIS